MKKSLGKFLNTPLGSILKVGLTLMLTHIAIELSKEGNDIFNIWTKDDWKTYCTIAVGAMLPMAVNYINKEDKRYGKKSKPKDFKPDPANPKIKP